MKNGFTVVETSIYMGLLAILLLVMTELLLSVLDVQLKTEATSSVQQDHRYLFTRLHYDINRATTIVTPALNGATTNSLQLTIDGVNYVYNLSGTDLNIGTGLGTIKLNGYNTAISAVSFTKLGNTGGRENSVRVNLTITSRTQTKSGSDSANLATTFAVRRN